MAGVGGGRWGGGWLGWGGHGVVLGIEFWLGFVCGVAMGWRMAGVGWPGHPTVHPSHPIGDICKELEPGNVYFTE